MEPASMLRGGVALGVSGEAELGRAICSGDGAVWEGTAGLAAGFSAELVAGVDEDGDAVRGLRPG